MRTRNLTSHYHSHRGDGEDGKDTLLPGNRPHPLQAVLKEHDHSCNENVGQKVSLQRSGLLEMMENICWQNKPFRDDKR